MRASFVAIDKWPKSLPSQGSYRGFESRWRRQVFAVEHERLSASSFKRVTVGSLPTYGTRFPGPKHRRRCTRLLTEKAGFEFLRTHQDSEMAER